MIINYQRRRALGNIIIDIFRHGRRKRQNSYKATRTDGLPVLFVRGDSGENKYLIEAPINWPNLAKRLQADPAG